MTNHTIAAIQRIEELEAENERLRERQESADLANEAIRWKREALNAQDTLQRVRDARSNHPEIPECDRYTDDDTIRCGWKSAVQSIDQALEGDTP